MKYEIFDMYKIPIKLKYKNKEKFSTNFGIFISICTIVTMILCCIYFGQDMYLNINPIISYEEQNFKQYQQNRFSQDDFLFGIEFHTENNTVLNMSRYLDINAYHKTYTKGNSTYEQSTTLNTTDCSNVLRENEKQHISDLKGATCIQNFNITIGGYWESDLVNCLKIAVTICKNSTSNNNWCYPVDEIQRKIEENLYIGYFYRTHVIMPNEYPDSIRPVIDYKWEFFDFSKYIDTEIILKTATIETDDGFLLSNYRTVEKFVVDDLINKEKKRNVNKNEDLINVEVFTKTKHQKFKRVYSKIQDVIAKIGGISKCIIVLGEVIVLLFGTKLLEIDLVNTFVDVRSDTNTSYTSMKNKLNEISILEGFPNSDKSFSKMNKFEIGKEYFKNMDNNSQLNYRRCEIFKSVICPLSRLNRSTRFKEKLLIQSLRKLEFNFDFIYFMKKFQQMELLIQLVIEEKKTIIFDYLRKPIDLKTEILSFEDKVNKLLNYLTQINTKLIDQKLLTFLDPDLLKLLNNLAK